MKRQTRILIVDDEMHCRLALKSLIQTELPDAELVGMASSAKEARTLILQGNPEIVLLDVSMPEETGFDLLDSLPDHSFKVIFVTAFERFALRAFRAAAVDYLLKPVMPNELIEAYGRACKLLAAEGHVQASHERLQMLKANLKTGKLDRISLMTTQGVDFIPLDEIRYLEAETNYTRFHLTKHKQLVTAYTLKHYEDFLEPEGFLRIHRSYLINLRSLAEFNFSPNPNVKLKDGTALEVSRRRAPLVHEALKTWKP